MRKIARIDEQNIITNIIVCSDDYVLEPLMVDVTDKPWLSTGMDVNLTQEDILRYTKEDWAYRMKLELQGIEVSQFRSLCAIVKAYLNMEEIPEEDKQIFLRYEEEKANLRKSLKSL